MGTTWSVRAVMGDGHDLRESAQPKTAQPKAARPEVAQPEIAQAVQSALDRVVAEMSQWEDASALSRFNTASPGSLHVVPAGFACVLEAALEIAELTGGAFDPTVGPATDAWGFGPQTVLAAPDAAAISAYRSRIGWGDIVYQAADRTLRQPGGLALDFSAIAKGYGVDQAAEALLAAGVTSFLVEVGGELRAAGLKPDHMPWWVEVESPPGIAPLRVALSGWAIATSGNTRRFHQAGATRIGHTIAPDTGVPVVNSVIAVSVLDRSTMRADALATALMVMGADAIPFANAHGIPARILVQNGGVQNGGAIDEVMSTALRRAMDEA